MMEAAEQAATGTEGLRARLHREHLDRKRRFFGRNAPAPVAKVTPAPATIQTLAAAPTTGPVEIFTKSLVAIGDIAPTGYPSVDLIVRVCAAEFGVSRHDLLSERRGKSISKPRQVAMYLAKTLTLRSLPDIGRRLGGRDHTTVLYGVREMTIRIENDAEFAQRVTAIRDRVETLMLNAVRRADVSATPAT